jgi:hypothetical protein
VGRLYTLLLGIVIGFALCMVVTTYHVIHSREGLHLVKKVPPRLEQPYYDLREVRLADLDPNILEALRRANLQRLLGDELQHRVKEQIDEFLQPPAPPVN